MRPARIVLLIAVLLPLGACATKKDVRVLREEMMATRLHQDSVLSAIQRQNRLLLDSVRATRESTLNAGGVQATRLREFDQNVRDLGQLVTQIMTSLNRIEQRLTALENRPAQQAVPQNQGPGPDELMLQGVERINTSPATARLYFEQIVQQHPNHQLAPSAQHNIGETYVNEKQYDQALAAFEMVAQQWGTSERARMALLRAGIVAQELVKDNAKARRYYTRVRDEYANTEEARQAAQRLQRLPR